MNSAKTTAPFIAIQIMILGSSAWAQQPSNDAVIRAQLHTPEPYELTQGTFINLIFERVDPPQISAMVYENIYDNFDNIAIPKGSHLFGHQANRENGVYDVYFNQIQLNSTGETYPLYPPLQATTPLGAPGIVDFKPAAIAGTILRRDLVIPH